MNRAVFFDRDDTLIDCHGVAPDGDLGDPALVRLMPGAEEACRRLKGAGYVLAVVSNQGGVARGKYGLAVVEAVNGRLNHLLGGVIDAFRVCPWHPEGVVPQWTREHPWRKPQPGMILDVARELGIDLSRSWMVGDAARDCEAGRAAGCRTVLVGKASSHRAIKPSSEGKANADFEVGTLIEAADVILGHDGRV